MDAQNIRPENNVSKDFLYRWQKPGDIARFKRIDDTNRLVYTVENDSIVVLSCRGHYED